MNPLTVTILEQSDSVLHTVEVETIAGEITIREFVAEDGRATRQKIIALPPGDAALTVGWAVVFQALAAMNADQRAAVLGEKG